jgi:hypothetical protein
MPGHNDPASAVVGMSHWLGHRTTQTICGVGLSTDYVDVRASKLSIIIITEDMS